MPYKLRYDLSNVGILVFSQNVCPDPLVVAAAIADAANRYVAGPPQRQPLPWWPHYPAQPAQPPATRLATRLYAYFPPKHRSLWCCLAADPVRSGSGVARF